MTIESSAAAPAEAFADIIEKPVPVDGAVPADVDAEGRRFLIGLDRAELADLFREIGEPEKSLRMRANQVWHWLYHRGATDFEVMTTMAKGLRAKLAETASLARGDIGPQFKDYLRSLDL